MVNRRKTAIPVAKSVRGRRHQRPAISRGRRPQQRRRRRANSEASLYGMLPNFLLALDQYESADGRRQRNRNWANTRRQEQPGNSRVRCEHVLRRRLPRRRARTVARRRLSSMLRPRQRRRRCACAGTRTGVRQGVRQPARSTTRARAAARDRAVTTARVRSRARARTRAVARNRARARAEVRQQVCMPTTAELEPSTAPRRGRSQRKLATQRDEPQPQYMGTAMGEPVNVLLPNELEVVGHAMNIGAGNNNNNNSSSSSSSSSSCSSCISSSSSSSISFNSSTAIQESDDPHELSLQLNVDAEFVTTFDGVTMLRATGARMNTVDTDVDVLASGDGVHILPQNEHVVLHNYLLPNGGVDAPAPLAQVGGAQIAPMPILAAYADRSAHVSSSEASYRSEVLQLLQVQQQAMNRSEDIGEHQMEAAPSSAARNHSNAAGMAEQLVPQPVPQVIMAYSNHGSSNRNNSTGNNEAPVPNMEPILSADDISDLRVGPLQFAGPLPLLESPDDDNSVLFVHLIMDTNAQPPRMNIFWFVAVGELFSAIDLNLDGLFMPNQNPENLNNPVIEAAAAERLPPEDQSEEDQDNHE